MTKSEPSNAIDAHRSRTGPEPKADAGASDREELWRRALEFGGFGTWSIDSENRSADICEREAELLGLEPRRQSIPLEDFYDRVHPDDVDQLRELGERLLEEGGEYNTEFRVVWPDGTVRWLKAMGGFLREDASDVVRAVGINEDITERKIANEQLAESRRKMATLLANLPGIAYRCLNQPHWPMEFVSRGARRLCGYEPSEIVHGEIEWVDLVHPDNRDRLWREVQQALDDGEPFRVEYRIQAADGSEKWVWEQGRVVHGDEDEEALEGFICDITAKKEAEQQLREADQRKDQFLAMLGHELRNPLGAIRHAVDMAHAVEADHELLERACGIIERQSQQMNRLVDGLLDITRITRGKIEMDKRRIKLTDLLRELLVDRQADLVEREVEVKTESGCEHAWVEADPARLRQVFDNLLTNAVKFSDTGDKISVEMRCSEGQLVIIFTDTGVGIDSEVLPHIFEPFQQGPQDLSRSAGGLGLGLALADAIVRRHGGEIEAASEGPDTGSTFEVRLPMTDMSEQPRKRRRRKVDDPQRVLIVEDNLDVGEVLGFMLERRGHEVRVTTSAPEALEILDDAAPDVVFCDLGLPGMSGYDFAREVRSQPHRVALPMVALTGYGGDSVRKKALEAGFNEHLVKPADIDQLQATIERLTG